WIRSVAPTTPIVVATGLDDETTAISALREGAQDYLVKDRIDPLVLERSIRYAIERQRTEEALRESNMRIHRILESITDSFFAVDRAWCFTYINGQCEPYFKQPAGDLMGKCLWDELEGMRGTEFEYHYRRAMEQGVAVHFESVVEATGRWF